MREDICRVAECRRRLSIRPIVMGRSLLASSRMAMLGEGMHACPDGVAAANHRPSIASAVCIGAFHDLDIDRSVMRLLVAAGVAIARPRPSFAFKSGAAARLHPSRHAERRYPFGGFGDRF
ncbi:hypothetical protein [Bradyrhizobium sp. CCGUVB14]|uniref:hypothetical protein n=1 Tax=Bradyrhizobium sp. CCGUVB14 TaxID=2949628 RepID=UPI0020B30A12|nr:hypothetical protein [Bradyrhizobium sp. CCGUVB14]MCP3446576.1 hypothetical protein [Bradyrhizobium sp. CCGUVB14]